ncbi:hypothetical protein [Priestia flexa]|uniref:hypothetical protein n=1 Tax=Priestia flexa TaxID=86664 RepID=UPI0024914DDE|nr:hypothetical protein [Priestia flexa]
MGSFFKRTEVEKKESATTAWTVKEGSSQKEMEVENDTRLFTVMTIAKTIVDVIKRIPQYKKEQIDEKPVRFSSIWKSHMKKFHVAFLYLFFHKLLFYTMNSLFVFDR